MLLISSCTYANSIQEISEMDPGEIHSPGEEKIGLPEIKVGAEQTGAYFPALKEKRVAVVGNQSSLIGKVHLVDSLLSAGIAVQKVFSPEHGFRGDADAGEHVKSEVDAKTGLPVISLYGDNKKPTQQQLMGIDVVVFDIQDVGVRFYTYISTLHYVMEACAEAKIPVIILDRPNPNGHYVDGPVLDMKFTSFVGMHPVPIVYGMTIGEYGKMINGEKWMENEMQCDLRVVPCQNYSHDRPYSLPIAPSPNLRSDISIQLYPSLCLLEGTTVTVGRGTDGPFERYGHPDFPEEKTTFSFTPTPGYGSKDPKHEGKVCYGFNLNDAAHARLSKLELSFLITANELLDGKAFVDREKFFNLLAGNDVLIQQLSSKKSEEEIRASWKEGLDQFKKVRAKYLIYHQVTNEMNKILQMNKLSSENLNLLPNPYELQKICKSISALEAIICPEWEYRYYSYQKDWSETEEFCEMRDGQGDQMLIVFSKNGTCINGFAYNSEMNGWKNIPIEEKKSFMEKLFGSKKEVKTELTQIISKGVVDSLPEVFNEFIFGEPVKSTGTTFCIWQTETDDNWQIGKVDLPKDEYKDGSSDLLQLLDGKPMTYKNWAEEYYMDDFEERELKLELVEKIYDGIVITKELVLELNPELDDFEQLKSDLDEIGYEHAI